MGKRESAALLALAVSGVTGTASADSRLNEREAQWVAAALPVVAWARTQEKLPLDIVVQPQPAAGLAPVAMATVGGRCKLVFSLRGNREADEAAERIPPTLFSPVIEAMVAHEVAHCWRSTRGDARTTPAGFSDATPAAAENDPQLRQQWVRMRQTRREEGFADLVGLAWTWTQHPHAYAAVHAWFTRERDDQPVPGSHHDTRAWLRLAASRTAFVSGSSPFEMAMPLWTTGLALAD